MAEILRSVPVEVMPHTTSPFRSASVVWQNESLAAAVAKTRQQSEIDLETRPQGDLLLALVDYLK